MSISLHMSILDRLCFRRWHILLWIPDYVTNDVCWGWRGRKGRNWNKNKLKKRFNPIRDGGVFNTLKMASKWPQISWLFLFLYHLSEKQKFFFAFSQWFWVFRMGWWRTPSPPRHLTYIFNPVPNRVNSDQWDESECVLLNQIGHSRLKWL